MPIRRLASATIVAALVALVGATASAQFGNILKKVPKPPSVPGTKAAAAASPKGPDFSNINDALVDKVLKGYDAWQKVHDDELAKAKAKTAEAKAKTEQADVLRQKCAQHTVADMMATSDCKDKAKEKDPRMKEARRLEDLVAAANDRGDEAKAAELSKKLDPLNEAIEIDADRACGGRTSAALHDCIVRKTAELSKQGLAGPMLQVQAQGACTSDPRTNGIGATGCAGEEQLDADAKTLNDEARAILDAGNEKAGKAQGDVDGLNEYQRAVFLEGVVGVLNHDPVIMSQMTEQNRAAINKRAGELQKVAH
jgi:hypothetical protein